MPDPNDGSKAFVQPSGPTKGFFIAGTWLAANSIANTDPTKYVYSTKIPYLVFPGSSFAQLSGTGDKRYRHPLHTPTGKTTSFILADKGGGDDAKLGEGSIALYTSLGGQNVNARTGACVAPGLSASWCFPGAGTRPIRVRPRTMESIKTQADALLAKSAASKLSRTATRAQSRPFHPCALPIRANPVAASGGSWVCLAPARRRRRVDQPDLRNGGAPNGRLRRPVVSPPAPSCPAGTPSAAPSSGRKEQSQKT